MRWRRPAPEYPDRRHAAAVARLFKEKREAAKREADRVWEELANDPDFVHPLDARAMDPNFKSLES